MKKRPVLLFVAGVALLALAAIVKRVDAPERANPTDAPTKTAAAVVLPPSDHIPATFHAVGFMVNTSLGTDEFGFEKFAFMGAQTATRLAVQVRCSDGGLFDISLDESKVDAFTDDRGTNLLASAPSSGVIDFMPEIAEDGESAIFRVGAKILPHPDATRLSLSGSIALQVASGQTTLTAPAKFEANQQINIGDYHLTVTKVGPAEWGDGFSIDVTTQDDLGPVIKYSALLPSGEEVDLDVVMTFSGMGTWQQTLNAPQEVTEATLKMQVWEGARTVSVPFDVETGIGLK